MILPGYSEPSYRPLKPLRHSSISQTLYCHRTQNLKQFGMHSEAKEGGTKSASTQLMRSTCSANQNSLLTCIHVKHTPYSVYFNRLLFRVASEGRKCGLREHPSTFFRPLSAEWPKWVDSSATFQPETSGGYRVCRSMSCCHPLVPILCAEYLLTHLPEAEGWPEVVDRES
jgi:hypothetical protein